MLEVYPTTFEEEFSKLKKNYMITLDKYKQCYETYLLLNSTDQKAKCNTIENKLDDIIDRQMNGLNNKINKETKKQTKEIEQLNKFMEKMKKNKNIYTNNLMRLDRGDLAAEPRRVDNYFQKVDNYITILYYIINSIIIIYLFAKKKE